MTKLLKMLGIIVMVFGLAGITYAGGSRGLGDLDREDLLPLLLLGGGFDDDDLFDFDRDRFDFDDFDKFDDDRDRFDFDDDDKFDFDRDRFDFDDDDDDD